MDWQTIESWRPYQWQEQEKQQKFRHQLALLTQHHLEHSVDYQTLMSKTHPDDFELAYPPAIAARLFKLLRLQSVDNHQVLKTITSSGTTQQVSKIALDKATITRQQKVLVSTIKEWIGPRRLPMLIIDHPKVIKDKFQYSARGAGIQGLMLFGYDHTYALNEDMSLNIPAIEAFMAKYAEQPVLMFGFTFMVWQYFVLALKALDKTLTFNQGILLHSGGWKKLQDKAVSNAEFKQQSQKILGSIAIHNFYGMAEQTGTIYLECEQGMLHVPSWGDIEVMSLADIEKGAKIGEQGVIKISSLLPTSYPGHVILTEDVGTLHGIDNCQCGRKGKYFTVAGRLANAETRGCSNV